MKLLKSLFVFLIKALALVLVLTVTAAVILVSFDIPIHLGAFREDIDEQLSEALGREISIDGEIVLVSGVRPSLRVGKVTVENPADWEGGGNLAFLELFETSIGLGELLELEIEIDNITVDGLMLSLEEDAAGRTNWESLAELGDDEPEPVPAEETGNDKRPGLDLDFTGLDSLTVTDLAVTRKVAGEELEAFFGIEKLKGAARAGTPIQLAITGQLLELPFEGIFTGGTLEALLAGGHDWPAEFSADLNAATLAVRGRTRGKDFKTPGTLEFALEIPDVRSLAPLTGPLPITGPVRFSGSASRESASRFRMPEMKGEIAGATVSGNVAIELGKGRPRLFGEIDVDTIDLAEVGLEQEADEETDATPAPSDAEATLPDTDQRPVSMLPVAGAFEIQIKEIIGLPSSMRDLALSLEITDEYAGAEVSVEYAELPLTGEIDLAKKAGAPEGTMDLKLEGNDADLAELVKLYLGDDRISGRFERVVFKVTGKGRTIVDAWDRRQVDILIANASMGFRTEAKNWEFLVESGTIRRQPGRPGEILAKGTLSDAAYDIRLPFHMPEDATVGHIDGISGKIADVEFEVRDVTQAGASESYTLLEFDLKGGRLDQLDAIYELDLPPLGPYAASGTLNHAGEKIVLEDLELRVGESVLLGQVLYDHRVKPRKVTATLNADSIQLDDFNLTGWSGAGSKPAAQPAGEEDAVVPSKLPRALLSYDVLSTINAEGQLEVGELLSGPDHLGAGRAKLSLADARLEIAPLTVAIPGGKLDGSILFHPKANGSLDWKVRLDAKRADYSVLIRRFDPDTQLAGILNLDLDAAAFGVPFGAPQLNVASGRVAFSVCPKSLGAEALDFWATNILVALLPKLDPDNESELNCLVAELVLKDGVLYPEALGLDTSTMRVVAEGGIDLKGNAIDLKLTPYPKKAQLLSIEAPVSIQGTLTNPAIEMGALPVTRTIGRMAKNVLLFPIKAIAGDEVPEDGRDVCACAANYTPDPEADGSLVPGQKKEDEDEDDGDDDD